jgi:hypothetical protein
MTTTDDMVVNMSSRDLLVSLKRLLRVAMRDHGRMFCEIGSSSALVSHTKILLIVDIAIFAMRQLPLKLSIAMLIDILLYNERFS